MTTMRTLSMAVGLALGVATVAFADDTVPNVVNSDAQKNTSMGSNAMHTVTSGTANTAAGYLAYTSSGAGSENTVVGADALVDNGTGDENTAIGYDAMGVTQSGGFNIAIGSRSGFNLVNGSNNIYIGSEGGGASESSKIRIGKTGMQKSAFMAGISTSPINGGAAVYVLHNGQLGVLPSSERYKTAIAPIASNSDKLSRLRPVSFHVKMDPAGSLQYGLIAEEVNKVYPELVIRDDEGVIQGVHYEELTPLLLNEVQKQAKMIADLQRKQKEDAAQLTELHQLQKEFAELRSAMLSIKAKDSLVASR